MAVSIKEKLIQILLDENIITKEQLELAIKEQKSSGIKLEQALVKLGFVTNEVIMELIATQFDIPTVSLSELGELDPNVVRLVPESFAQRQNVIAFSKDKNKLKIALSDPSNISVIDELKLVTGYEFEPYLAQEDEIKQAITKYYATASEEMETIMKDLEHVTDIDVLETEEEIDVEKLAQASEDAPIVKLVNMIISEAVKNSASDIHIEVYEKKTRIRYRIDGVLKEVQAHPKKFHPAVISRIKIMANLDIAERRKPQDGRIKIKLLGREVDMRVSTLPTTFGEKAVIRILDTSALQLDLAKLGFEPEALQTYKKCVEAPYGMILVTGPTGSGKTTTLYSTLSLLNYPDVNILTIEDPVEFVIHGINQVAINPKAGLTFAEGLRSFLRQDPDIIMVGEIRDKETANIAINAALTGHLVLSTLHTNDAPGAITRLDNMGVEPFLISSSLLMVIAQRLMRKICPKCKESYQVSPEEIAALGIKDDSQEPLTLYRGVGCSYCFNTGYKGRTAIYEVMEMNEEIRKATLARKSAEEIKKIARASGMMTLREAAFRKVKAGISTIEELLRVTLQD